NNLGVCFIEQGRYDEAEEQLNRAQEYGAVDSHPTQHSLASDNLSILYYESGDYDRALENAKRAIGLQSAIGRRGLINAWSLLGLACLKLGRIGPAREARRELRLLRLEGHPLHADLSYMHIFHARMQVTEGNSDAAVQYLESAAEDYATCLAITRWRILLEACRIGSRSGSHSTDPSRILRNLQGTGANPLIQQARSLERRSRNASLLARAAARPR
ncbi:MAG: tetratricopeptide repeat protein, partial [Gemmatimonadota bacterium]